MKKKKKKKDFSAILLVLIFFVGLSVLLYPTISDYINSRTQSRAISSYNSVVEQMDETDYETELETAHGRIEKLVKDLSENIFISEEDKKGVAQYVATLRKEIAWARVDVRKLRYGDES